MARSRPMGRWSEQLEGALEGALGGKVAYATAVPGGDINRCYRVAFLDGRVVFLKVHQALPGFFEAEAAGLAWLRVPGGPRVPAVLDAGETGGLSWLALEHLELAPAGSDRDARMGRAIAALHRAGADSFGAIASNFIGPLPQDNEAPPDVTWGEFYANHRLRPLYERARRGGHFDSVCDRGLDRLVTRLDELFPEEPPARLHGDLWGGNAAYDDAGAPVVFDPAAYGGHREMDLAMMRLFGGFGARVFDSYHEVYPLAPDADTRAPLAQLYPLLVHVLLFGGGYERQVRRIIGRFGGA